MIKILITGVNGFVARHFLDFLETNKIKSIIWGLDISDQESHRSYHHVEFKFIKIDLLERVDVEDVICKFSPNYVLHLASYSSVAYSWDNPVQSFRNNTNIFLNLVDAFRKHNIRSRILSVGSSEEYGNINVDHLPLTENSSLDPISPYAVARVSQEMLSKLYSDSFGVEVVMTRSFNHIGPGQKEAFVVPSFIKRSVEQKREFPDREIRLTTGDLSIVRDFLDVRDVVSAYWLLLTKGEEGQVYNVCSGEAHPLSYLIEQIGEKLNCNIITTTNPDLIRPNDNKIIVGDNSKLSLLGWKREYSIEQSISDIIDYWTK